MTIWLPAAARAVNAKFWHRPRRDSGWFVFGGCLFWLVVVYLWALWMAVKLAVWLAVLAVLAVAQVLSLAAEAVWRPVAALRHPAP